MSRYFTEEAVRSAINLSAIENVADANHNYAQGFRDAMKAVEELPESIVRCEDCKYMRKEDECELWCQAKGWPAQLVRPDDFCSRGKRKEKRMYGQF